uniref:Uncharacterized protein n=1 Tax=Hildenbrandia rubra TaxID=31481 RepID=A0A1C9CG32_9FLOR|nr:hypothetical protein Hrub_099 [Hildenbrandia rubra]AOM67343.1 hypothetical protein Hrub_099 [Hildenbrandia rubra]
MSSLLSEKLFKTTWPDNLDEHLDEIVAYLFCQTRSKIMHNLVNKSQTVLMLDLIIPNAREKLLILVLQEFESLILDIAEAELSISDIYAVNSKILYDLVCKSGNKFLNNILQVNKKFDLRVLTEDLYFRSILKDNKVISGNLISYLLFGTSESINISFQYVEALLHNLIIKISDLSLYFILNRKNIYKVICQIPVAHLIFSPKCWSMRSIEELQNNLAYQNIKYFYVDQPKAVYSNRYQVIILSPQGILDKTVAIDRLDELSNLSHTHSWLLNLLEVQDFFLPKFKYIIFITGRIIIYISFSIINNLLQFLFHAITRSLVKLVKNS